MPKKEPKRVRGVFERPKGSGIWWILYYDELGNRHREKVGMRSAAISAYQRRKTEIRHGKFTPEDVRRKNSTVHEIIDDCIFAGKAQQLESIADIEQRLRWWRDQMGDKSARSVLPSDIENARLMLCHERKPGNGQRPKPGGLSTGTVNRYLAALKAAFSLAVRNGKVEKNPLTQVKLKKENNCRVRWLTPEEEGRLLAVLPVEYHAMVKVALHTGLRRMEQFGLMWSDLNFQQRLITVRESKSGESRTVPMNEIVYQTLQRLPRMLDNPFVFPGAKPQTHRTDLPKSWERFLLDAGITDFHWHDLRHTFASRLVMAGVDLYTV